MHFFFVVLAFARFCLCATIVSAYDFSSEQISSPSSVWKTIFFGPVLMEQVEPGTHDQDWRLANDIASLLSVPSRTTSLVSVRNSLMPFALIPMNT